MSFGYFCTSLFIFGGGTKIWLGTRRLALAPKRVLLFKAFLKGLFYSAGCSQRVDEFGLNR